MTTHTDKGKAFERSVESLLSLIGYSVGREQILGHKKIDLYFEERRLGSVRRVAVECKAYGIPVDVETVAAIYASYLPLHRANLIDEILVVTERGITPAAETMVRETRELLHMTFADLQTALMDFDTYLKELVYQYKQDGLSEYYVPLQLQSTNESALRSTDLDTVVLEWVAEQGTAPIAILGGYGLGKTTFARHISHLLAERALAERHHRVPILLRLGEISAEQTLEGLLGKALTATSTVRNYSFEAFMRMNRDGRFVVILDGFDEMKFTLTWEEFRYNFKQLNRLVVGDSRIILLGRPTAFLNDDEHQYALHGLRSTAGYVLRDPEWPDYVELYLAPFVRPQVDMFLQNYLTYRRKIASSQDEVRAIDHVLTSRINQLSGKRLADISRRPVQLKMLAEILPQWHGDVNTLTTAILYSVFIDWVIERELEKDSRLRFGKEQRREFARLLAWWMWTNKGEANTTADRIPPSIISRFVNKDLDSAAVARDLVAACFLEKKLGQSLYFPHRSFQEFLVAEQIVESLSDGTLSLDAADRFTTYEVSEFLSELISLRTLQSWQPRLEDFRGTLSWNLLSVWLSSREHAAYIKDAAENSLTPWMPLLLTLGMVKQRFEDVDPDRHCEFLLERIKRSTAAVRERELGIGGRLPDLYNALLGYLCIVLVAAVKDRTDFVGAALEAVLKTEGFVLTDSTKKQGPGLKHKRNREKMFSSDPLVQEFRAKISYSPKKRVVDLSATYQWLCGHIQKYCFVSNWVAGPTLRPDDIQLPQRVLIKPGEWETLSSVLESTEWMRASSKGE